MRALRELLEAAAPIRDYAVSGPHWFGDEVWERFASAYDEARRVSDAPVPVDEFAPAVVDEGEAA